MIKYEERAKQLQNLAEELNAELISFEYRKQVFGNMVVKMRKAETVYDFVTDRGEIYYNNSLVCDASYHQAGKSDTFSRLVEIIKKHVL